MKYMLLIYGDEAGRAHAPKEAMNQMFAAYGAYTQAMQKAGAFVAGAPLQPTTAPPPCASMADRPKCSTAPMPRPRNNWAATT